MTQEICFVTHQAGPVFHRTLGGKQYLVVPTVALVPGVLNGELVTAEAVSDMYQAWNGQPVTLGHPPLDGENRGSANYPDLLEEYAIGRLFNTRVEGGLLKGEVWIDELKLQGDSERAALRQAIQLGEPVDVSTAYFRRLEKKSGTHNGRQYYGIAHDLRPDHLAVLIGEAGACSWTDGCGLGRNEEGTTMQLNILSEARTPEYTGLEDTDWADVSKALGNYIEGYYAYTDDTMPDELPTSIADLPQAARDWIAAKTLLGDPESEDAGNLLYFPVVNPNTDNLNAGALRAVLSGRGAQADIPAAALESARSVASRLLEEEFGNDSQANSLEAAINKMVKALDGWIARHRAPNPEEGGIMDPLTVVANRFGFEVEELEELPPDLITRFAEWEPEPCDGTDPEPEAERNMDQDPDPEPDVDPDQDPELEAYRSLIEEFGDIGTITDTLRSIHSEEDQAHNTLVDELAQNEACQLTRGELEPMSTETLTRLRDSLVPADYSGRARQHRTVSEETSYELPPML